MGEDVEGHTGVGKPANQEEDDHDDNHAGDFLLCLLSGGRLLLLGSRLQGHRPVSSPWRPYEPWHPALPTWLCPPTLHEAGAPPCSYLLDCEDQLPIAEKDDDHRNGEVDHEHVDDEGFVVDLRLECVVVNPA